MDDKLLTRKEVAEQFGVKPGTVKKWDRSGTLSPHCRLNNRPRYRQSDVNNLYKPTNPDIDAK